MSIIYILVVNLVAFYFVSALMLGLVLLATQEEELKKMGGVKLFIFLMLQPYYVIRELKDIFKEIKKGA